MNRRRGGTILVSALLILAAFTIAVTDVSAATSPPLGVADSFGVLGHTTVTNTGPTTITGNLGDEDAGSISGLASITLLGGGALQQANALAGQAQVANTAAFTFLDQVCTTSYAGVTELSTVGTLVPGVYCADAFTLSGTLRLSGSGVWIFKSASTLITSGTANVVGGDPCNVWWRVVSSATLGTNTALIGNILALTSISLQTGARLSGRALAQTGAVTLDSNNVNGAICRAITTVTTTVAFTTIYTTAIDNTVTTITTVTTIVIPIPIFGPISVAVGGETLPVDALQLFAPYFVAILIAAAAIGLVMYKRRTQ